MPGSGLGTYVHDLTLSSDPPYADCAAEETKAESSSRQAALKPGCSGGRHLSSNHRAILVFVSCCLSIRVGAFITGTHCIRRCQLHTWKLHPPPSLLPNGFSPFLWLRILSKVENAPEKCHPRTGDFLESLSRSGLGEEDSDSALPPPRLERPLSLGLVTENMRIMIVFPCQGCCKADLRALRGPSPRVSAPPETPLAGRGQAWGWPPPSKPQS